MATVEELQNQINTLLGQLAALPIEDDKVGNCTSTEQEMSRSLNRGGINDSVQKLQNFDYDDLKARMGKQEDHNKSIIIGVLVAFILIVFSTAITVILSYKNESEFIRESLKENYNQKIQNIELLGRVENIEKLLNTTKK